ncbi:MAG: elongation factor 4, partial [Clostridiales bacterium]|nr:elongation factor 4 [Clostridiales bacterium]
MPDESQKYIRNFCIIAHIDHGKSTLADRLIEHTHVREKREMTDQILDNMDIERERGITIKSQAARLPFKASDGNTYMFNLIDTPGHVDFNYEVSRSLAACDGAILVVDASQGVEAQTLANVYLAVDANLEVLPVINKIDLPSARPEEVRAEIEDDIGIDASYAPLISAKNDINIDEVLESVVKYLPAPEGDRNAPFRALIFDSKYDPYKGVIVSVRVREGTIKNGSRIKMMHTGKEFTVTELGYFHPGELVPADKLEAGEVGYICASIKNVADTAPGDTVTSADEPASEPLIGYKGIQQMVFCGIYPVDGARYGDLKDSLEKLRLNDAALSFDAETSAALGFGFRCGFLGLLHYEVIEERLEREFGLDLISTAPSVIYKIHMMDGSVIDCSNPTNMPEPERIDYMEEPVVKATIMLPKD